MSSPLALPIRILSQSSRQTSSTQCLRQRSGYVPLDTTIRQQRWTLSKRAFATTPRRARAVMPQQMKQQAQPSANRMQKEQQEAMLRSGQLPDDIGLLPDTFIMPRDASERRNRTMLRKWLKSRFNETWSVLAYKWFIVKPRPNLELFSIASKAATMHQKMYKAFAAGDMSAMQGQIASGLLGSLRGRIAQRAPNTYLEWSVKKQLSPPRLCSYKAVALPGVKGEAKNERNCQVQAVVRLHTLQSLQHVKRTTKRVGNKIRTEEDRVGGEEKKESFEYVVLQKSVRKGKANDWQIWGFTDETRLRDVEKENATAKAPRK